LVERDGNDFVASQIADVADVYGEVPARLPLNIQGLIEGVWEFIRPVIVGKGKQMSPRLNRRCIGERDVCRIASRRRAKRCPPRILETSAAGGRDVAGRDKAGVLLIGSAELRTYVGWRLCHAEWPTGNHAGCDARGKIREQLAAVVVHAPASADNNLVVEHLGTPGHSDAGSKAPLATRKSRIASHPWSETMGYFRQ